MSPDKITLFAEKNLVAADTLKTHSLRVEFQSLRIQIQSARMANQVAADRNPVSMDSSFTAADEINWILIRSEWISTCTQLFLFTRGTATYQNSFFQILCLNIK